MTREVKRYQVLAVCTHPSASITYRTENVESCDGEYVLYSDYAALKVKADGLAEAARNFKTATVSAITPYNQDNVFDVLESALAAYQAGTGEVDASKGTATK